MSRAAMTDPAAGTPVGSPTDGSRGLSARERGVFEQQLGADLGRVRVHEGAAVRAALEARQARALTTGPDVLLGALPSSPRARAGVLAHELTHVVQQGAAVRHADSPVQGSPGQAPDVQYFTEELGAWAGELVESAGEAWSGAERAVGELGTAVAETAEEVGEAIAEGAGEIADLAEAAATTAVDSVEDLLALLDDVSEEFAARVMAVVARLKPGILIELLIKAPMHILAPTALALLTVADIAKAMHDGEITSTRDLLRHAARSGYLPVVLPAIGLLALARVREIFRAVGVETLQDLLAADEEQIQQAVQLLLDDIWPVNTGVRLDAGLGATFGIPLYVGGDALLEVLRPDSAALGINKRGEVRVAADTGVSAGLFIGRKPKGKASPGGVGLGLGAGAQAEAGVKMILLEKYYFPLFASGALQAFSLALVAFAGTPGRHAVKLLELVSGGNVDPEDYLTRRKFDFALYGQASAEAFAGLRRETEGTLGGRAEDARQVRSGPSATGPETGDIYPWYHPLKLLTASLGGRVGFQAGIGFDMQPKKYREVDGRREPALVEYEVYAEGSLGLQLAASVPGAGALLPNLSLEPGMGVKLKFKAEDRGDGRPTPEYCGLALYAMSGELDYYAGPGSETEFDLPALRIENLASLSAFLGSLQGVTFRTRVSMGGPLGRRLAASLKRQRGVRSLLKKRYGGASSLAVILEGYATFTLKLDKLDLAEIFAALREVYEGLFADEQGWTRLYTDILAFFQTGRVPDYAVALADLVLSRISVTEATLRAQEGVGLAGGAQIAAAAKARLHGNLAGMVIQEIDLLTDVAGLDRGDFLNAAELLQLLRDRGAAAPQ